MKKYSLIFLCLFMMTGILAGCKNNNEPISDSKLSIVTTTFPQYDWAKEILGSKAKNTDLTMLVDNGVDLHSYQPTADDMIKISTCDMFIYVGGESDGWVEDALKGAVNEDMVVINLMEVLGDAVKEEDIVEGMQEDEHDHGNEEDEEKVHEDAENGDVEYDEHVWLSLQNAKLFCKEIADKLVVIDADHKDDYNANASAYIARLSALDAKYKEIVDGASKKTILFGDRFPFRYLAEDYGLNYYAAFPGCSAETEASFATITYLAKRVDQLDLSCVLTIEGSNQKIANTIVSSTTKKDQQVFSMDSLQSTTVNDVKESTTYLFVMQENLEVLEVALK